jgi:membrane peptidoglycan carboxypeptidase
MPEEQSPWDDAGFWRSDDRGPGRDQDRRSGRSGRSRSGGGDAPRRARPDYGTSRDQRGGRFSQTADDLRNRLGLRGSVLSHNRDREVDEDFWGESDRRGPDGRRGSTPAQSAKGRGRGGAAARNGWNGSEDQAWPGNGHGSNGNGSNGSASNGSAGNGNGSRGGYRGSRRANGTASAAGVASGYESNGHGPNGHGGAHGFHDDGAEQWPGRTSVRDRAARLQDGVRSRTATLQRPGIRRAGSPGGPGGPGDGGGWGGGGSYDRGPLSRGQRFKRWLLYGSWWRHWTWRKALAVAAGAAAACILLGILAMFIIYEMTPIPTAAELTANWQSSTVYFSNGKLLGTFDDDIGGQDVDRELLTANQIPVVMTRAMAAAEDRNFYTEGGISISGLTRAALEDVFGSGSLQGGSTITMQYAKNYYSGVNTGQNANTKLKEIFIAMKLAHERSKSWIMTQYLNTVPFGPTVYGVGAAAQSYFDVNLAQGGTLTISQAAMLAAMPNEPGVFNPQPGTPGYAPLVARWHYVLTNMMRDGVITQAQAKAQVFPTYNPPRSGNGWSGTDAYLMQMVEQQLEAPKAYGGFGLTQQQIDTGGYRVTTTYSESQMTALARSVKAEKQQLAADADADTVSSLPGYDHIGSVLENAKTGAIVAIYGGPGYLSNQAKCKKVNCQINTAEVPEEVGSSFKPYVLATAVGEFMNVFTSRLDGYAPIYIPEVPADAKSTELALSVSKPPAGATDVSQYGFWLNNMFYYYFNEASENSGKPLPVNVAAAISSDPAFEDLAHRDGIQNIINMAGSLGVGKSPFLFSPTCTVPSTTYGQMLTDCNDLTGQNGLDAQFSPSLFSKAGKANGTPGSPAIALGEGPLTAVEQATTFATLADDGIYHAAHVISALSKGSVPIPVVVQSKQALSPAAAADVDWALSFDNNMNGGTAMGTVTFHPGGLIAKTGTLGSGADSSEAWFVGATPKQYAMSVALYTNDPGSQILDNLPATPSGEQGSLGGGWPASIWNNFFTAEWGNTPDIPVDQIFPTTAGYPFVAWIQATAQPAALKACRPGQTQHCKPVTCRPTFGQPCNPDPGHSCGILPGQQCTSPSPGPSCGPFSGGQCTPSPDPSASPSPSCSPSFPGECGNAAQDADIGTTAVSTAAPPVVLTAAIETRPPVLTGALSRAVT